jgi:hypothetical protein
VRFNCLYVDTTVAIRPGANPQTDTFMLAVCPDSITVDPDNWILDSASVTGIEEMPNTELRPPNSGPTIVRDVLHLPGLGTRSGLSDNPVMSRAALLDAAGRVVLDLHPGPNDVSGLAPGVYFCHRTAPFGSCVVNRVVLTR